MSSGVSFADGDNIAGVSSTMHQGAAMSSGGPVETPSDDSGRTSGMNIGNNEEMPPRGDVLDCPASY